MNDDRKKPAVAFWTTLLVVVMLIYPICYGPACWRAGCGRILTGFGN
jgi:hypothetical protein